MDAPNQPGPAAISPQPDQSKDHDLTGRLSRPRFAKLLSDTLEEVAPHQRAQLADAWCEQLIHFARNRRITWYPSLASATTPVSVTTAAVQTALEQVLDATPPPHRRAKEEQPDDDAALTAALRRAGIHSPAGRDVTTPPLPAVSTTAAPEGGRTAGNAARGAPVRRSQTAAAPGIPDPGAAVPTGRRLA